MSKELRGTRYLRPNNQALANFILTRLRYLDYEETLSWYRFIVPQLDRCGRALLGCNDRYFLLTGLLSRVDALHPWLFDRCREVESDPDGHMDLWSRFHYKSTIISCAGVIQEIICNPEIKIVIFSAVKPIAQEFLSQIKEEFESNELLKAVYPDVLWADPKKKSVADGRPPKWGIARGIVVKRASKPKEATVEAHGLLDGQPTSRHFDLHVYDDMVTQDYITEDQIKKTTERWEMADNLGSHLGVRKWMAGTRYCTTGNMRVLMGDWSHKPIADVRVGETVVGWELRDGKRYLRPAKVVDRGVHFDQPVNRYTFNNGRHVVCTKDHRWWRGPHGGGPEYAQLCLPMKSQKRHQTRGKGVKDHIGHVRQLLIPTERDDSRDAAWLAGFFDGEGTIRKNTHHPSGIVCIVQSMANALLIEETRRVLARLGFKWSEAWISPGKKPGKEHWHDRCIFNINGGWRERYRFLAEVAPVRRQKLTPTLFAQLATEKFKLISVEPAGTETVHWLQTETGNYVIEGFCSSNSFADTYGIILERRSLKPRVYPATEDGTLTGRPVFLSQERWDEIKNTQRSTVSAQMLLNPIAGVEATFHARWLKTYDVIPAVMNVYMMADPSKGAGERSDRTAIAVVGIDGGGNRYLLDGVCHRMKLSDRWTFIKQLRKKWLAHPGVQIVKVGYERYGMQTDLEVIAEWQERDNDFFELEELNTPRTGGHSKKDRIERLEPDLKAGIFYLPIMAHHSDYASADSGGTCYWRAWKKEDAADWASKHAADEKCPYNVDQIVYSPARGPTRMQRYMESTGQKFRVVTPIKRRDENNDVYDLTRSFLGEALQHPFAPHDDLLDATSRLYDMDPIRPVQYEAQSVEPLGGEDLPGSASEQHYDA